MIQGNRSGNSLIELVIAVGVISLLAAVALPAVQRAREGARRSQCTHNLRSIGSAMMAFEAANRQFPKCSVKKAGPPLGLVDSVLISQHYHLLPYLDQFEVQRQFDPHEDAQGASSEPPVSRWNATLLTTHLAVFHCPSDNYCYGGTSYRACSGTSPSGYHTTPSIPGPNSSRIGLVTGKDRFSRDIRDGLSQTVFFSEKILGDRDPRVYTPWTDTLTNNPTQSMTLPDDALNACRLGMDPSSATHASFGGSSWLFGGFGHTTYNHIVTPNSEVPDCTNETKLWAISYGSHAARSYHPGGVHCLFGDGAVKFVSENIDLSTWRALGTIDGNEIVDAF